MKDKTYTPDYIVRPSDTIKESMEYSHKTVDDLCEEICLYDMAKLLTDEIQINERIAVALSKVLGSGATFWMNLSNNYFAAKAQEEECNS
jgi:plasmid maintenance system antidote protein VapI